MARLAAGKFSRPHQPVAFHDPPGDREHQPEGEIGGRLGGDRRNHGHGKPLRRCRGHVDVRG